MFSRLRCSERWGTLKEMETARGDLRHKVSLNPFKFTTCASWNTFVPSKCQQASTDNSGVPLDLLLRPFCQTLVSSKCLNKKTKRKRGNGKEIEKHLRAVQKCNTSSRSNPTPLHVVTSPYQLMSTGTSLHTTLTAPIAPQRSSRHNNSLLSGNKDVTFIAVFFQVGRTWTDLRIYCSWTKAWDLCQPC